jgi:cytochrome P450
MQIHETLPPRLSGPGSAQELASGLERMSVVPRSVPRALRRGIGVVHAAEYWMRPDRFIRRCIDAPKRFTLDFPGAGTAIALRDPEDLKQVFRTGESTLQMVPVSRRFFPHAEIFGEESMIGYEGEPHIKSRRLVSPSMHGKALASYEDAFRERTEEALAHWPYGAPVPFRKMIAPIALEVILTTVFGVTDPDRHALARARAQEFLQSVGTTRFALQTAWATARGGVWDGNYSEITKAREAAQAVIAEEIRCRRENGAAPGRPDVLQLLLDMQTEASDLFTETFILNSMAALLIGGYETTATTLGWTANLITREAAVLDRLHETVDAGDDSYAEAIVTETLRLRPPGAFTFRGVVAPFSFRDGLTLQPGSVLLPMLAAVMRDPDVYDAPEEFRPERFVDERPGTYTWVPFGGGSRRCLGGAFSMAEMRVILSTIARHARFRTVDGPPEPIRRQNIILIPKDNAIVTLDRRASRRTAKAKARGRAVAT